MRQSRRRAFVGAVRVAWRAGRWTYRNRRGRLIHSSEWPPSGGVLTWCKPPTGFSVGGTFGNSSEFILYARRGRNVAIERVPRDWWDWPRRGGHSAKPEAFLDLVEQTHPAPRLEMFARRARFGWDYWGDQSLGTAEFAA